MTTKILKPIAAVALAALLGNSFTAQAAPFDKITVENTVELSSFEKVYIAPVQVELDETTFRRQLRRSGNTQRPVSESDQARRAEEAHEDLVQAFTKREFTLVDAPGEDVLTVETVLTRLDSTRPTIADFSEQISLSFQSVYAGGADFDIRLSQNDTPIAQIDENVRTFLNDGRPRVGVWQDTDYATRRVARKLAKYVRNN